MTRRPFLVAALAGGLIFCPAALAQQAQPTASQPAPARPERAWGTPLPAAAVEALRRRIGERAEQGPHSRFDPATSALVLVEFQRDWLDPRGTLRQVVAEPDAMDGAAKRAERALAAARAAGMRVVHVGIGFEPGHPEPGAAHYGVRATQAVAQPFRNDTPGVEWMPPFEPRPGEFVPRGRTGMSAFAGSNLDSLLRNNGVRTLYVAGFATEVCFESTIREGHDRGYDVVALTDATASFTEAARDASLKVGVHHFAYMMDTDRFVRTVGAAPAR